MAKKDPLSPATTSMAYDEMLPKWHLTSTLLGGTTAMREAGRAYLPQHNEETNINYEDRLFSSTLYNLFELTLNSMVGKPFSDPVILKDDVPERIETLCDDIDLQGNNLSVFARNWFKEAWGKAFAHVLIDYPSMTAEERVNRTLADDIRDNRRPYWIMIQPEDVIFMHTEVVNGVEVLMHVRIREFVVSLNGFAEEVTEQIRVLEPGVWEVWREVKSKTRKKVFRKVDEGTTGLDFIPMATFYTSRDGIMSGKPLLEDLAFLNIRHWQSTADQINILTVARFPMLAVSGATDTTGQTMKIGPRQLLGTKDPQGRYYYVEHKGDAIEAGRQDLLDLEEMMAAYGAEFLKRRPGNATATARVIDQSESVSVLQDTVIRFIDVVEQALWMTAKWLGLEDGGSVEITSEFHSNINGPALKALLESRKNGDISRDTFLIELQKLGILNDEFDPVKNLMQLMAEVALLGLDMSLVQTGDFNNKNESEDKKNKEDDDDEDEET